MLMTLEWLKLSKKLSFKGPETNWKQNTVSRDKDGQNISEKLVFMWNSALRQKFNFYFQGVFC